LADRRWQETLTHAKHQREQDRNANAVFIHRQNLPRSIICEICGSIFSAGL
jgi:hypothetical protein